MKLCCYECKGPFGLSRRYRLGRAFCSQRCLDAWTLGLDQEVCRLRRLSCFRPPARFPALKPPWYRAGSGNLNRSISGLSRRNNALWRPSLPLSTFNSGVPVGQLCLFLRQQLAERGDLSGFSFGSEQLFQGATIRA